MTFAASAEKSRPSFGGACAVSFAGAELLTHSSTLLGSGLEPAGLVTPWVLRLLTLGFAVPVLAAAVVGGAAGALWLRYRAPRRDRERLKLLGHPGIAVSSRKLAHTPDGTGPIFLKDRKWS